MHVFFESVWKLHIGEIPARPDAATASIRSQMDYAAAIAAIKQNALTVGNPRIIPRVGNDGFEIFKLDGNFHKWPGGYETKEKELWTSEREPASCFTTVAILTLPEEKTLNT